MLLHLQLDLALHNIKSIGKVTLTIENFIFELGMTLKSRFENDKLGHRHCGRKGKAVYLSTFRGAFPREMAFSFGPQTTFVSSQ